MQSAKGTAVWPITAELKVVPIGVSFKDIENPYFEGFRASESQP
jgi:hypothetical protein